jgi:hypothetical protein
LKITRKINENFTVISNEILKDKNVSLKAKGLHVLVMSLPDSWDFSVKGISTIVFEGTTAVRSAIKELIANGYCIYTKNQNELGQWEHEYKFFQSKQENPNMENPDTENPNMENPSIEKPHYNKELSNKELNNKELTNNFSENKFSAESFENLKILEKENPINSKSKTVSKEKNKTDGGRIFEIYVEEYEKRWGQKPANVNLNSSSGNSMANSQCCQVIKRIGLEKGIIAMRHYFKITDAMYVKNGFSLGLFLQNCETIHMMALNGITSLQGKAKQIQEMSEKRDKYEELINRARERDRLEQENLNRMGALQ